MSRASTEFNVVEAAGIRVLYNKVSLIYIHMSSYYIDLVNIPAPKIKPEFIAMYFIGGRTLWSV